ncbi:MAG: GIY-YIG nuclease family protein, partial [Ignavibacteria bacterium]|nr:GIY-YIG nuclease family protein [Ignavibacteria bacterium]
KYTVYVIKSSEGLQYTGTTEDVEKRIIEHNNKTLSFWTKRGSNWEIIYKEEFESKAEALKREKWLKSGVGRNYIKETTRRL